MIAWVRHRYEEPGLWYALVCGVCLGIGFIVPVLWWWSVIGIAGLIHLTMLPVRLRTGMFIGVLSWLVKYLCALSWSLSVYPIMWIADIPNVAQLVTVSVYWITGALWLSVGGGLFAGMAVLTYRSKYISPALWYVLVSGVWVGSELFGAFFFSVMTLGPGSSFQPYLSFGMNGYLLTETSLGLILAGVCGVWGLSFFSAALGIVLVASMHRSIKTGSVALGCILLLFIGIAYIPLFSKPVAEQGVTVVSIDTTFDDNSVTTEAGMAERVRILEMAITAAMAVHPTYILLPEDSRFLVDAYGNLPPRVLLAHFLFTHPDFASVLIDSHRIDTNDSATYLRATLIDGRSREVYQFDKQYLVPQGEYIPFLYDAVLRLLGFEAIVTKLETDSSYRPGPLTRLMVPVPATLPAVLFCSESVRPDSVATLLQQNPAPFVVHPLSHSWFHHPTILWHELDAMLRTQARVSGVPIVSAGNMVSGKLYVPNGKIETGEMVGSGDGWLLRKFSF